MVYLTVTFPMILTDPYPSFQGHGIFEVEYLKKRHVLKSYPVLLHKRKLYLTYGMVLRLVNLTDL